MDDSRLKHGPAWDDVGVGVVVLIVAAIIGWQITLIPTNAIYAQVGPKLIPWIATAMLAVLGVVLTLQGLRGGWQHEDHGAFDPPALAWLLLGLGLNVALISVAGFIIASTLLFVFTAIAFGSRQILRDTAIGFTLALVSYVGFDRVLGYKIGSGLIEGWL